MDNRESKKVTKKITVSGIVQGVGFRPFVYNIAKKHGIPGTVRNIGGLVEIILQSSEEKYNDFLKDLKENPPYGSKIINIETEDIKEREFRGFRIIESRDDEEISIIPPDLPVCESCERELFSEANRRFLNPFINCMSCGARYTIIEELPYDRHNTTMRDFDMCPSCREEYTSPKNRRFHAQTISCYDCGPYLIFNNLTDDNELTENDAFEEAAKIIESGGIIAVKGIGGYHFACSPFKEDTVLKLRELKGREAKPFAIMFESVDSIRQYCIVSEKEEGLLKSNARPIVLLYLKNGSMAPSACQGSIYCGAFLPYTPLQMLLIKRCGPLIMTSANISNKPIIKDDQEMLSLKSPLLNGVLYNKRRIVRSVDDSVAKVVDSTPQLVRRSRGYVPYPVFCPNDKKELQIFAAGGDLKASFCLYKNGNAVMSQYFGDLEERTVLERYKASVKDLCHLLKITPDIAVCDMHPNYYSAKFAQSLDIPLIYVQHHHAHIASVMAEHHLEGQVIGVAFDGTGYGTDGQIWGGEFLICEGAEFKRAAHLRYTPVLGGDASMRDAAKTAVCFLISSGLDQYIKDERKNIIKAALKNNINTVLTSSMGRLFDAVSSLLGIRHENRYEGECAAMLEKEAVLALRKGIEPKKIAFEINQKSDLIEIDPKPVLESLCHHRYSAGIDSLALGFHYAVADIILKVCEIIRKEQNINTIALSGGVFQNTVLMERVLKLLRDKYFNVYYNVSVPPNDGSIGLGQTFIGLER